MQPFLAYEVKPGSNVAQGLPRLQLVVLSPVWRGASLLLEYPDGEVHTLVGWSGDEPGAPCDLRVFWTRHRPEGPPVCLAIGGEAGVRNFGPGGPEEAHGVPFLALADSLIPPEVLEVIGPPPGPERLLLL